MATNTDSPALGGASRDDGPNTAVSMPAALFAKFRDLVYEQAGIQLRDGKEALVATRIARRMRELGLGDASLYLEKLRTDESGDEMVRFIDAISTNFTSFYREADHFELLKREAIEFAAKGGKRFRLWCAASSTGEEPYTIALTLADAFAGRGVDHRILATDISTRVLAIAVRGVYMEKQVGPVPEALRNQYFSPAGENAGEKLVETAATLKQKVTFKRLNLAKPPFPMRGPIDVVMCRNVMIYFDQAVRQKLIGEVERLLKPGGLLIVGHSETLNGVKTGLRMLKPSVYRKSDHE